VNRDLAFRLALIAALIALGVWIALNTYWGDETITLPPKGEAARNPYYSVERLSKSLGIETREISSLRGLEPHAVVLINNLKDDLLHEPLESLETWVESGGRLIVPGDMLDANAALQTWTGIKPTERHADQLPPQAFGVGVASDEHCKSLTVRIDGTATATPLRVCAPLRALSYDGDHPPRWSLSDKEGLYVLRTGVGSGEVTVFGNRVILGNRTLTQADHAEVFIAGIGVKRGEPLLILTPGRADPLIVLLWRLAAPAILFLLAAMLLLILRHLPRFGPPVPAEQPVRRSLAEQIRANARFSWRTRNLRALRSAAQRALDEAARREILGYATLSPVQRAQRLASATGIDAAAIGAALTASSQGGTNEQRASITLMEVCRRLLAKTDSAPKGFPNDR
jgi:hypothetical protein